MKFVETQYLNKTEILKFPDHYVAVAVMVSDSGVTANVDGKKIVLAGTIVGGATKPVLANLDEPVIKKNTQAVAASVTLDSAATNSDLTFTAQKAGADGNNIKVQLKDPGQASQSLAVNVEGDTIVVNLATDGASALISTAADVADAVNTHLVAKELVLAEAEGDGTGVVDAIAATPLAGGNDGTGKDAEGVLLNDVDVTYGPAPGAMVIHGFIATDKLPEAPCTDAIAALKKIQFIK